VVWAPASSLLFGRAVLRIVQEALQQKKFGDTFANILMMIWYPTVFQIQGYTSKLGRCRRWQQNPPKTSVWRKGTLSLTRKK